MEYQQRTFMRFHVNLIMKNLSPQNAQLTEEKPVYCGNVFYLQLKQIEIK